MDSHARLMQAFQMQFEWVSVLLTDRQRYSSAEKKRAILFPVMQLCYVLVFFVYLMNDVISWALLFVMQCCSMAIAVIYLAVLEDYAESVTNAMGVEKNANLILVAGISVRCFSILLSVLCGSWILAFFSLFELGYDYYVSTKRPLLVDATTLWKDIPRFKRDSRIRVFYSSFMLIIGIAQFVYRLVVD